MSNTIITPPAESSTAITTALTDHEARELPATPSGASLDAVSEHVRKLIERYKVVPVPCGEIVPSPENDEIYGAINHDTDPALGQLVASIERIGLEEPIILTTDNFILSGHRRFAALREIGWAHIPVRYANVKRGGSPDYHRLLAQYNPQRIKSCASLMAERFLETTPPEAMAPFTAYLERKAEVAADFIAVAGDKPVNVISDRRGEFLEAAISVINDLRQYWPLTVRQIHYRLLNAPPLTQVTKDRNERWRYKNDLASYSKLSTLLVDARYAGNVSFGCIEDATRETVEPLRGFKSTKTFIDQELSGFLSGYHRDGFEGQPNYVEVIIEKNTLLNIVSDICKRFYIPLTPLRGYGGPSIWKGVEDRINRNHAGRKCILLVIADHDPEGFNLVEDAVRSLRYRHKVKVSALRVGVTLDQVREQNCPPALAKETSSRFEEYIERTGTRECWECEALDPAYLRRTLQDAILNVIDVDQMNAVRERQHEEQEQLRKLRRRLGERMASLINEEGAL